MRVVDLLLADDEAVPTLSVSRSAGRRWPFLDADGEPWPISTLHVSESGARGESSARCDAALGHAATGRQRGRVPRWTGRACAPGGVARRAGGAAHPDRPPASGGARGRARRGRYAARPGRPARSLRHGPSRSCKWHLRRRLAPRGDIHPETDSSKVDHAASPTVTVTRFPSRRRARSIVAALVAWSGLSMRRTSLSATPRSRRGRAATCRPPGTLRRAPPSAQSEPVDDE